MNASEERERRQEQALRSVLAVSERPEFENFISFLKAEQADQDVANRTLQGVQLAWGQGEAQRLQRILTMFENAPDELNKIKLAQIAREQKQRTKQSRRPA